MLASSFRFTVAAVALAFGWTSCERVSTSARPAEPGNVLMIVVDDIGVDRIGAYAEHPEPGRTPNIDQLAREGVLFRNVWANPKCSPTRATLLTGRYSFRTGVGQITSSATPLRLDPAERTLPRALGDGWSSAALGKWHLAGANDGPEHPLLCGFGSFAGSLYNIPSRGSYSHWQKQFAQRNGDELRSGEALSTRYATSDTVDDALEAARTLPEPWFLYVAFHASHLPLHAPPAHLHGVELGPDSDEVACFLAATEALDTELGRLLAGVGPRTTVVFVADNGTPKYATTPPFVPEHAKGSLYEGGVNVPLIVRSERVARPGSECAALVNTTDLFATVLELAGRPVEAADTISLVPYLRDPERPSLRTTVFAEVFQPDGSAERRALREARFKLIRTINRRLGTSGEELYDLADDPFEHQDLLRSPLGPEAASARERLGRELDRLLQS